jgi:hypothetical protein
MDTLLKRFPIKKDIIGIFVGFSTNPVKHAAVLQTYSDIDPAHHYIVCNNNMFYTNEFKISYFFT